MIPIKMIKTYIHGAHSVGGVTVGGVVTVKGGAGASVVSGVLVSALQLHLSYY